MQAVGGAMSWPAAIIDMLLTFVLDVLLYGADKTSLGDWISMLSEAVAFDQRKCKKLCP
jgi:hypothetical protein